MGQIDQRLAKRYNVALSAEIFTETGVLAATTRNLSASGVGIEADIELTEGRTVAMSLFLTADGIEDPDTASLNVRAKIVWCASTQPSHFSAGASFEQMSEENRRLLDHFLSAIER